MCVQFIAGKPRKKPSKPSKQTIDDIEVVTSEFSGLQIPTDDEDDSCSIISDGCTWMKDGLAIDEMLDNSCVLMQTPSHDLCTVVNSSSDVRLEGVLTRESYLAEVHDDDSSNCDLVDPVVCGTDEACSHSADDEVFLPLSERLRQQKAVGLKLHIERKPEAVTRTQLVADISVAKILDGQFHGLRVKKTAMDGVSLRLAAEEEQVQDPVELCKKSQLIANSSETITPVVDSDVDRHQTFANNSSDCCTEHRLRNASDIKECIPCTEQQLDISPQSYGLTETNHVSTTGSGVGRHSLSSIENSRFCRPGNVIASPDLFDSSYSDDGLDESTLTPSTGHETDHSLCRINQWDVETPMISDRPNGNRDVAENNAHDRVSAETRRRCCSIDDTSYSRRSIPDTTCSPILKRNPVHSSSIERTSLDDSAFVSCDSIGDNSTRTHPRSESHVESISGQFGNFDLCSSLLCESNYQSDCDDSVFISAVQPLSSDDISSSSNGCRSIQKNHDDASTRPPHSDILLHDTPAIQSDVLVASSDVSTSNCDKTMQHVSSPVCLADRLKLRLARTNKAHLVSCLSRDAAS